MSRRWTPAMSAPRIPAVSPPRTPAVSHLAHLGPRHAAAGPRCGTGRSDPLRVARLPPPRRSQPSAASPTQLHASARTLRAAKLSPTDRVAATVPAARPPGGEPAPRRLRGPNVIPVHLRPPPRSAPRPRARGALGVRRLHRRRQGGRCHASRGLPAGLLRPLRPDLPPYSTRPYALRPRLAPRPRPSARRPSTRRPSTRRPATR